VLSVNPAHPFAGSPQITRLSKYPISNLRRSVAQPTRAVAVSSSTTTTIRLNPHPVHRTRNTTRCAGSRTRRRSLARRRPSGRSGRRERRVIGSQVGSHPRLALGRRPLCPPPHAKCVARDPRQCRHLLHICTSTAIDTAKREVPNHTL